MPPSVGRARFRILRFRYVVVAALLLVALTWRRQRNVARLAVLVLPLLVRRPVLCGLLYGVVVFLFMYEIVLPFSRVARDPHVPARLHLA